ncbi:hypothetical protein ABLE93_20365 [Xanthobacter sp. KR7-65]|uniref:hypothetical protein n=1 Tax=Xanthobacter sp. KR7-65 TaxID=3156612 RepID=UPI0032B504E4
MNALELTAFGLFGIVLTLAVNGMTAQKPYMTVAGGLGIPVEDVLTQTPDLRLAHVRPITVRSGSANDAAPQGF